MVTTAHADATLWYEKRLEELAKDLHDGVSHQLVAILWEMECLKNLDGQVERTEKIVHLSEQMRGVINDLQEVIYGVRPMLIDELGLVEALRFWMFRQLNSRNIQFQVVQQCEFVNLPRFVAGQVFRIVQEGVNNILSHAQAQLVTLTIQQEGTELIFLLSDNGRGFDDSTLIETGLGLQTMKERAQMIHGNLHIMTQRGVGTTVKIIIPLEVVMSNERN